MSRLERRAMTRHRPNNSGGSISSSSDGSSFDGTASGEERATSVEKGYFDAPSMARMESHDSYRMPWSSRKSEDDSDPDWDEGFSCSLAHDFDRLRRETEQHAATNPSVTLQNRHMWLDSHFDRLTMKYRSQPGGKRAGDRGGQSSGSSPNTRDNRSAAAAGSKPHFLDLSSIISPVPLDITTPPASQQTNPDAGLDTVTPKPSFAQRFASTDGQGNARFGNELRAARQPLQPCFGPNMVLAVGSASSGPTSRSLKLKASQDSLRSAAVSPTTSTFPRPALRSRRSFDNPAEVRRRQRDELEMQNVFVVDENMGGAGVPQLPDWARHQNRANQALPSSMHAKKSSDPFRDDQGIASAVPLGLRASPMSRGVSHDTAMANPPTPTRSRLGTRASSGALRIRADRSAMPEAYPTDLYSPISPSFPPPPPMLPMLSSSRASCGSSTGSDSMPPTPSSATFIRPLVNITPPRTSTKPSDGHPVVASPQEKDYQRTMMAHHSHSHLPPHAARARSPSTSSTDEAEAVAWSRSRAHLNVTPRAAKHSNSYSPGDHHAHALMSPPRSSSLRRNLSEAGEASGAAVVASELPYADERDQQQHGRPDQLHSSWGSESHYSNSAEDDAGSAYMSAVEQPSAERPVTPPSSGGRGVALGAGAVAAAAADAAAGVMNSRWSPPTPVLQSASIYGRGRANSRADEWASSIGRRFAKGVNAKMA
ncbi:uncharacterized protein PSFLO_06624 [Pseudozyma flocculosa]|uniref:Uncharacterized protein n=1 Tax=Pseudozyma flocculosa TaxID=84751 RepID=A0A5C3F9Q5_9BASI|nr:uncharacterized protein PSFLO_06624 [Pseudozyma flocculosa]